MIKNISDIGLQNPGIELRFHTTPESIFNEFWNLKKDLSFGELLEQECGGTSAEGEEITPTLRDVFAGMVESKYWVFAAELTRTVHVWLASGEEVEADLLRIVIGHEIGHILESQPLADEPDIAAEQRADNYGLACWLTERFIQRILFERS